MDLYISLILKNFSYFLVLFLYQFYYLSEIIVLNFDNFFVKQIQMRYKICIFYYWNVNIIQYVNDVIVLNCDIVF